MEALEPWLLEGAPVHYRDAGLTLFQETETGRLWVQQGGSPRNPYGDAQADVIAWPDPMAGMESGSAERQPVDPHAGHR